MTRPNVALRAFLVSLTVGAALLARPVTAADEYPAPAFFLNGLTAEARWSEILSKPGMKAEFPFVGFESTFVALDSVCVDGPMLAIANPRLDTGVRTSAATFRAQAEAASAGAHAPLPGPQLAAATPQIRRGRSRCTTRCGCSRSSIARPTPSASSCSRSSGPSRCARASSRAGAAAGFGLSR